MSEASLEGKGSLLEMLKAMVRARASDIHLQAGAPPTIRVDGKLRPFGNRPLTPKDTEAIAKALLTPEQVEELEYRKEMDFAHHPRGGPLSLQPPQAAGKLWPGDAGGLGGDPQL